MGKDCGNHGECKRRRLYRLIAAWVVSIILVILLIILIVWLALRPTKPRFYLQDATVQAFNLTGLTMLTSTFQVSISARNPNDHVGIYYDKLDAYAEYKDQQITYPTSLPPGYHGHNDVEVWSPYLIGEGVPVAPFLVSAIQQDEESGMLLIKVKLDGRLRWKVGSWISSHYHIYVECPAWLTFEGAKSSGCEGFINGGGSCGVPSIKLQQFTQCSVDV